MATSEYKPVSFSPGELVSDDKTEQLVANISYLKENMPRGYYAQSGIIRIGNTVMLSSMQLLPGVEKRDTHTYTVNFPAGTFDASCIPVVTVTPISNKQHKILFKISGKGKLMPDSTGFNVTINIAADVKKADYIKDMWLSYTAVGFPPAGT